MTKIMSLYRFAKEWMDVLFYSIKLRFISSAAKDLEIIALRSQLSLFIQQMEKNNCPKPKPTPAFRQLWVLLSKYFTDWKSCLIIVRPETIIKWHKTAFKFFWMLKSRKIGRPTISMKTIALIKQIHKENPLLSPEKIHEKLLQLGISDTPSPNTISKYFPVTRKPPSKQIQSWKLFLKNHSPHTWGMDFFTIPTLRFEVLYVLVIIHHGTREIIHSAATKNPNLQWLKQQIRTATPYDQRPKFLIHDNDSVFVAKEFQEFLVASGIKSKKTSIKSPWQNPYTERVIGILRQELLHHIIPFNEEHLHRLLKEYIHSYYNPHRTQGIKCKTPIPSPKYRLTMIADTNLSATPILDGLYHSYEKAA